ncbi:hypothetical protein JCGZ_09517 [Jatropha curcas]|uniref:Uncharacterized protein n=1 Tax=Jatropha curcas TaxID=180498 RepID=A0A067KJM1_JATCU|nr:hypothetical protein JCGZ_09517 [Jatropha curcas]
MGRHVFLMKGQQLRLLENTTRAREVKGRARANVSASQECFSRSRKWMLSSRRLLANLLTLRSASRARAYGCLARHLRFGAC